MLSAEFKKPYYTARENAKIQKLEDRYAVVLQIELQADAENRFKEAEKASRRGLKILRNLRKLSAKLEKKYSK